MGAREDILAVTADWDRAMLANDAAAIGRFMSDDWVIVGSDGSVGGKEPFLALVASGALSHDTMETRDLEIRVHGDTAITVAAGVSGGHFRGQPFRETERSTNVFVRQAGGWICVHTHLSALAAGAP